MLFSDFDLALGKETRERIRRQLENYDYYSGKQHVDPRTGQLVKASELERPPGLDYDPARYATNYFKAIIDRKARWQMGGHHGIHVPRKQIDDPLAQVEPGYEPSAAQVQADEMAENYEDLLETLWRENKTRARLIQAARDRLIADRVVCKLAFNQRTGKLRWIWRPDNEFVPIYSDDDFEDLIACHFVQHKVIDDPKDASKELDAVQIQTFALDDESGECFVEEHLYRTEDLELLRTITEKASMGIDFLPVVTFSNDDLLAESVGEGEIDDIREQNDVLNRMNEDAIDSLKFEMFSMTAVLDAPEGTADKMHVAPGAVVEARGAQDGARPDIKKVEGGFRWKEAFKDQYARVKGAMHEISGLPQIVPQELNFGGLNGETLQVLFKDIIADTEEDWLIWGYQLAELHEKSVRYLQARLDADNFAYDKSQVRSITDYTSEVKFVLPLPDNRKELVELISLEMAADLESQKGGMERLGVDNVKAKKAEIAKEQAQGRQAGDPYALVNDGEGSGSRQSAENTALFGNVDSAETWVVEDGELTMLCPNCGGSGKIASTETGKLVTCSVCNGDGKVEVRQR